MCNYDYGASGFCENCAHFPTEAACIATGFITNAGTEECKAVCLQCEKGKLPLE